jgi:hypothetical protein
MQSPASIHQLAVRDEVRVPDGREGWVIGFYRRKDDYVCVAFSQRDTSEFLLMDVVPLAKSA